MLRKLLLLSTTAFFLTASLLGTSAKPAEADIGGLVGLINNYRQSNGLGLLAEDQNLVNAACWLAADMEANGFSHTDSQDRGMSQRLTDFGVGGSRGENIYYTTANSSANNAFTGWKNSSGHDAIMKNPVYTRVGVGMAYLNGRWYWVADFANGSANSLTSQCNGTVSVPKPPPPPAPKKAVVPPPPPPTQPIVETPAETPVATIAATIEPPTYMATKSATPSIKLIEMDKPEVQNENSVPTKLVKGAALTILTLSNLLLFSFIIWGLVHHFSSRPTYSSIEED